MLEGKKACVDENVCYKTSSWGMYVFDDGASMKCLTRKECEDNGYFMRYFLSNNMHECVTETKCNNYETNLNVDTNKNEQVYYSYS